MIAVFIATAHRPRYYHSIANNLCYKRDKKEDTLEPKTSTFLHARRRRLTTGTLLAKPEQDRIVALSGVADEFREVFSKEEITAEYAAGNWLSDFPRALFWEQETAGPHRRITSIPTWSWASVLAPVKWPPQYPDQKNASYRPGVTLSSHVRIPSIASDFMFHRLSHDNVEAAASDPVVSNDDATELLHMAGNTTMNHDTTVLSFKAKLHPIILGKQASFSTEEEANLAACLSGLENGQDRQTWRPLASYLDKDHVAGWASVEHSDCQFQWEISGSAVVGTAAGTGTSTSPGAQGPSVTERREILYALHIGAFKQAGGSPGLGHVWGNHMVYCVLLVRKVERLADGFERVGIGRVFGTNSDRDFKEASMREVRLVWGR
ncbi:hypothetical protein OQA88_13376 [Cercophora sp. LCS_1]